MPTTREFELVPQVKSPGLYFFASNMKERACHDLLPGGGGLSTDNIFGVRPHLDRTIPEYLQTQHPRIESIIYSYNSGVYVRTGTRWYRHTSPIRLEDEYYSFFQGRHGGEGADIPVLNIYGIPKLVGQSPDGSVLYQDGTDSDPNGVFELELTGSGTRELDPRGEYWRGILKLGGDKLGLVIASAIEHVNEIIAASDIPVWKVTEADLP